MAVGAVCLATPGLALGTAIAVVDPDDFKPAIARGMERATGRPLSLNGPLRISKSLWPTIEIDNVRLGNLPGGSRPDMAWADRIQARLSLPALLWRRIEFDSLTLIGPNILFEQVDGQPNWIFGAPGFSDTSNPAVQQPGELTIRFRQVHVTNGMVTTRLPARTNVIGIQSLDFRRPLIDGPLDVSSVLVYSDNQPFNLAASASPTGSVTDPWKTQLTFTAYDTRATATGTMDLGGAYDLRVEGVAGALEKLNAVLPTLKLPALRDVSLSTHVRNGPTRGDLPIIGRTALHFTSADLGSLAPGLTLGVVDVALPSPGGAATYSGTGILSRQAFAFDGHVGVPEHPDATALVPFDLRAQAEHGTKGHKPVGDVEGSVSFKGHLSLDNLSFAGLDGSVQLRAPVLAALRPFVSPALPALTSVVFGGTLAFPTAGTIMTLRDAKLSCDQGDLAGEASVGLGAGILFNGKLRAARLDVDALADATGFNLGAPADVNGGKVIPDYRLPWNALKGSAIDLAADISAMIFQGQMWRDTQLVMSLDKGLLKISRLRSTLPPGGPLDASFTADAGATPVAVGLTFHAQAVPLATVARQAGLPGPATGSVRIDTHLRAFGSSTSDIAASLDGPVSITLLNGSISNNALRLLASAPLAALSIAVPSEGTTAIRCLGFVGTFSKGVAQFGTVAVDSTYLKLAGAGTVSLATEQLALKLFPFAQISGSLVKVPVVVEGPWRKPVGQLDASGLDQLGFLVNGWFGGDQSTICADAGLN